MSPLVLSITILTLISPGEAQIRSRYAAWDAAYLAHDVRHLAALLDPKFVLVTGHGKAVSRKDYIARLWKSELPEAYETEIEKLNFRGDRATVWTLEKTKKSGSALAKHRYEDTWRLRDGRWRMIQSKTVGGH